MRRKKRRRPADAAAADQIMDEKIENTVSEAEFPKGNKLLKGAFFSDAQTAKGKA